MVTEIQAASAVPPAALNVPTRKALTVGANVSALDVVVNELSTDPDVHHE
jgi:hypothetical protein